MNGYFYTVQSRKRQVKMLHARVAIGASGNPTLGGSGFSAISREAAGTYELTLMDQVPQLVGFQCTVLDDTTSPITHFQVTSDTVSADGKLIFKCFAPTDASTTTSVATDPADGSVLLITLLVNNTSLDQ